jgi:hypothetical protein
MPVIPACGRQRQEDHEFKASMGYTVETCFKTKQNKISKYIKTYQLYIKNCTNGITQFKNIIRVYKVTEIL